MRGELLLRRIVSKTSEKEPSERHFRHKMLSHILTSIKRLPRCQLLPIALRFISAKTILHIVNVVLRVPALFIAEIWCRTDVKTIEIPILQEFSDGSLPHSSGTHDFVVSVMYYFGKYKVYCSTSCCG